MITLEESEWINEVHSLDNIYSGAVKKAIRTYTDRVIAAYELSEDMGRRATESWGMSVDTESINKVTQSIVDAYVSGKAQAEETLPKPQPPPELGFRAEDMNAVNKLREFTGEEIMKLSNELRIIMRLRAMERQPLSTMIQNIKRDLVNMGPKVDRLAATEVMRAANEGRINEYKYRGISKVAWVSLPDSCSTCSKLNGRVTSIDSLPPLPHHPNCSCTIKAVE